MSPFRKSILAIALLTLLSSGCCLTTHCGVGGCSDLGCAGACGGPGIGGELLAGDPTCGAAGGYVASGVCDASGSCGSCGPTIPCKGGCNSGGLLGLGCIGKLFHIGSYGCGGCVGGGCGETYYHDWINDPPCGDPCDCSGTTWTGVSAGPCGSGCGGCSSGGVGGYIEPGCGIAEPACGIAEPSCGASCGGTCGGGGCAAFNVPGRALYSTWTGFGGFLRGVRRGFLPHCENCNAFSFSHTCGSCAIADPSCGCEIATNYGSGSVHPHAVGSGTCSTCTASTPTASHVVASNQHRIPHEVVTRQIKTAHNRPPHKVLTKRLR